MSSNQVVPGPIQLNFSQYDIIVSLNQENQDQQQAAFEYILNVVVYASVVLVLLMVVALLIKLLGVCDGELERNDTIRRETDRLISKAGASFSYGTCDEDDLESGNCSRSSSSEDLYDENICIVCYDKKRDCFFIPCGHCTTCHSCAKRIAEEENKNCPICRRVIRRVRRVLIA
ncbi:E3 ubiquitin-protein ligase APD2-like [Lycium ferocissimum]|uniref:E3 ubiquitin-protein ligase APD2-like n=1 Tax=Lycium ferocissimum TaxID=112874 RepID=UPI002815077A|nr:E3 ubiquitin-protein ligase APD2-like [Lycium ferocissimum]